MAFAAGTTSRGRDTPVKNTTVRSTYGSVATSIETILRYETTIERFMFRALDRLRELQSARVTDLEPLEVTIEAESVEVSDPSDLLGDLELDADAPKP